jgi:light-regulated signal transduction histidine kinase (bacteriophytochrome)
VTGFVDILVEDHLSQLDVPAREAVTEIRGGAVRMGQMVDGLLAFARLGQQGLQPVRLDPAVVARRAWRQLGRTDAEGDLELSISEMPPCSADSALLEQVYANLLSNALKYRREKVRVRIEVDARKEAGQDVFTVRDNGIGFDMRHAEQIFGVFKRLHSRERYDGSGIGLAIVQRIVERHGGRVWAEGERGQGATFCFTLGGDER